MTKSTYFYQFLEVISKELAYVARELEHSIYTSPRTMLTHGRIFIESILKDVVQIEKLDNHASYTIHDHIKILYEGDYIGDELLNALHEVRKSGNYATHEPRAFKVSEALAAWEHIYIVVKWYVEVYGPVNIEVPPYSTPLPLAEEQFQFERTELETRLERLEQLLKESLMVKPIVATKEPVTDEQKLTLPMKTVDLPEQPGMTPIRSISYQGESIDIPYFLRDAFILPQRFHTSERFLIRLGGEQQARLMSELPNNLEGLHRHVKNYNARNDEQFFNELKTFVAEEIARMQLKRSRPGELFFFYQDEHVVVTDELATMVITTEAFTGFPSFIKQLHEQGFERIGQLPYDLATLGKYRGVGKGTIEKFFAQLKEQSSAQSV